MTKKAERTDALYDYLRARAVDRKAFSFEAIQKAVPSWTKASTWRAYVSKTLSDYVVETNERYTVASSFKRVTREQFAELFSQKRNTVSTWSRATYDRIVVYEFLMPLTREDKLRASLDDLFYLDTIDERFEMLSKAEREELEGVLPRTQGEQDATYKARVAEALSARIGGYSIGHVAGRFRAADLCSREAAAQKLVARESYLIDETTAVVRFIVPLCPSRPETGPGFMHTPEPAAPSSDDALRLVRVLFFLYFAEAVAATIRGEQLIWLVERSPAGERIYAWEKTSQARTGQTAPTGAAPDAPRRPRAGAVSPRRRAASSKRGASSALTPGVAATPIPTQHRDAPDGSCRHWLRANGYSDVADLIDEVEEAWRAAGVGTRRNWWQVLAGDAHGRAVVVGGKTFPVLHAAQLRQKVSLTRDALRRARNEQLPALSLAGSPSEGGSVSSSAAWQRHGWPSCRRARGPAVWGRRERRHLALAERRRRCTRRPRPRPHGGRRAASGLPLHRKMHCKSSPRRKLSLPLYRMAA